MQIQDFFPEQQKLNLKLLCKSNTVVFLNNKLRSTEVMQNQTLLCFLNNKRSTEIMHIKHFYFSKRTKGQPKLCKNQRLSQQQKLNLQRQRYASMAHQEAAGSSRGQNCCYHIL